MDTKFLPNRRRSIHWKCTPSCTAIPLKSWIELSFENGSNFIFKRPTENVKLEFRHKNILYAQEKFKNQENLECKCVNSSQRSNFKFQLVDVVRQNISNWEKSNELYEKQNWKWKINWNWKLVVLYSITHFSKERGTSLRPLRFLQKLE